MDTGQNGVCLGNAQCLVEMGLKVANESVQTPNLNMVGLIALDLKLMKRLAMSKLAKLDSIFFRFGGILGSASMAEFSVSLNNHVVFTPRLLYSSTHHSPESFTHLETG